MAYLVDNPPARSQYRSPRRERPSGVMVVHTAENTPDTVATDGGAEAVANFIRNRTDPGSYHDLVDSDSGIQLVRYSDEAFQDGTGSNPHAWGGSVATTAAWWPLAPVAWRNGAIRQLAHAAARYALWLRAHHGIVVPARRINRAESEARVPGFISHAERDPARRSDPGAAFPWDQFLDEYAAAMSGQPLEDDMPLTDADKPLIRSVLDEGVGGGQLTWAGTSKATLKVAQDLVNISNLNTAKILAAVGAVDDEVVAKIEGPLTDAIVAAVIANLPADSIGEDALREIVRGEVSGVLSTTTLTVPDPEPTP